MEADWTRLDANVGEIPFNKNNIARIVVNGKPICLVKTAEGIKACSAKCPHAAGDLSEGYLDNRGNIVCPIHQYRFNIKTGRDSLSEGYFLKTYPILQQGEEISIKLG